MPEISGFRSVVCAIDFSEASRIALREAARVVRQFKATLHVVFAEDPLLAATLVGTPPLPDLDEELRRFVDGALDVELPTPPVLHVAIGESAGAIIRVAGEAQADLIVIGAHGLAGSRDAFFGSTTVRILNRATTCLWIVPAANGTNKARDLAGLGAIVVLCDFGATAAHAGQIGARLAAAIGARLVLVHVMPSVAAPASWSARVDAAMEQRANEAHRQICGAMPMLERLGPVESVIASGNIAACVADVARSHQGGLILIGLDADEHGPHPGSTALAVIASAPVPVLTVPAHVPAHVEIEPRHPAAE